MGLGLSLKYITYIEGQEAMHEVRTLDKVKAFKGENALMEA